MIRVSARDPARVIGGETRTLAVGLLPHFEMRQVPPREVVGDCVIPRGRRGSLSYIYRGSLMILSISPAQLSSPRLPCFSPLLLAVALTLSPPWPRPSSSPPRLAFALVAGVAFENTALEAAHIDWSPRVRTRFTRGSTAQLPRYERSQAPPNVRRQHQPGCKYDEDEEDETPVKAKTKGNEGATAQRKYPSESRRDDPPTLAARSLGSQVPSRLREVICSNGASLSSRV